MGSSVTRRPLCMISRATKQMKTSLIMVLLVFLPNAFDGVGLANELSSNSTSCNNQDGGDTESCTYGTSEGGNTSEEFFKEEAFVSNIIKDEPCVDTDESCEFWAGSGECEANPGYMLYNCKKSCHVCVDTNVDFGTEQITNNDPGVLEIVRLYQEYYFKKVLKDPQFRKVAKECKNRHESCAYWVSIGECEKNPGFMKVSCALACRTCDLLDMDVRCPKDPDAVDAFQSGDLNKMFERITNTSEGSEYAKYAPVVHSRPLDPKDVSTEVDYKIGPWVATFETFLTDEECDRLIKLGGNRGYERSTNVGKIKFDGTVEQEVSTTRTSKNTWCQDECSDDPMTQAVVERIANVTGVPSVNQEQLQLLNYDVGQFYRQHHDYILLHVDRQQGPRILTFFLYLNDVEEGGGTKFNNLDITITPKKGMGLLWPSVLDADPNLKDIRTEHEALAVIKGKKYAANAWIHLRDMKTPLDSGCS